ncbi:D-glycero-beta-D-manno-heptose-7-phosphate kinase [Mucilaginibacter ginsenosidivorans]|uniref:D-glycero-beta-D-manno-heptose-7-phosphate kinase n=1 Tax=Mucilaginibacter ginsenosidivorans TaxID=398053 RepID=A0A5B8V207_9SPHI|nr:D-glycero-beta-D-manno-heptose-7-phosphate kinase [Mucilaginibacter ginsenosidivorans]QEC64843.1 D-glycero-beta-D-manno-heptose-7-phosphate kinase [Mucilaginibacter ginsenosidivorans]
MLVEKVRRIQQTQTPPAVLVIGDLMIDHYVWGDASRLSPEAPVPIVNVKSESTTLGGAANVAQNLVALGAEVTLSGVVGNDSFGAKLKEIMRAENLETDAIIVDQNRPTTVKTRVLAGSHQLVRIDREITDPIRSELEDELAGKLDHHINEVDIVLFSDYGKGLFSEGFTQRLIKLANSKNKKVIVDPKGFDYGKYKGAFIIKPNRKELAEAAKTGQVKNIDDLQKAARVVLKQTDAEYLVVTLSDEGIIILDELTHKLLPTKATAVFDVTGAGDTVLATMAYFIASGLSIEESCELANHAAAIVIRRVGSATTTIDEIIADIGD